MIGALVKFGQRASVIYNNVSLSCSQVIIRTFKSNNDAVIGFTSMVKEQHRATNAALIKQLSSLLPTIKETLLPSEWLKDKDSIATAKQFSQAIDIMINRYTDGWRHSRWMFKPILTLQPNMSEREVEAAAATSILNESCWIVANIFDDVSDCSVTRFQTPVWHVEHGIGRTIADLNLLNAIYYHGVFLYYRDHAHFREIQQVIGDVLRETYFGQRLDVEVSCQRNHSSCHTRQMWDSIGRRNSGEPLVLVLRMAFYAAGFGGDDLHRDLRSLGLKLGSYFKAVDDYLDVFGTDYDRGTDIAEGRVTWMTVTAWGKLRDSHPDKRNVFLDNIGVKSKESVNKVIELMEDVGLKEDFAHYLRSEYEELLSMIKSISNRYDLPIQSMSYILNDIYMLTDRE